VQIPQINNDYHYKVVELTRLVKKLSITISDFATLISESEGVAGLHLNGEIADWGWLIDNQWLENLPEATYLAEEFLEKSGETNDN
jgi:hypothetical protein